MKNSRTSTKKKIINNNKKSTSSASTNKKKATLSKKNTNIQKNKNTKKNIQRNTNTRVQKNTSSNINRDTHNANNNIRLKRKIEDEEYVPFFDDNIEKITPNNLRKVESQKTVKKVEKESSKIHIRPITVIKFVFFIAIITAMLYLMFTLETFNLTEIEVEGNEKYTKEEIISNSNLTIGENTFKQLLLNDKSDVKLSYVSKVKFNYEFPSTIVISVEERYPAYIAVDKNTGNYYKLDNEGYLLEQCDVSDTNNGVIILEGFVFEEEVEFGEKINEVYIKKIEIYNTIKNLLEEYEINGSVTRVNFSNSLTMITLDDKLKIIFANDSNLEYKVSFLKGIIQKNSEIEEGTIDMSIENPVYSKYD